MAGPPLEQATLSLVSSLRPLPCIATHTHPWGIDHGQAQLIPTRVLGRTGVAQPALVLVDTLRADLRRLLPAHHAWEHWRVVSRQHLHGLALPGPEALCQHPQLELCGGAKVVLVGARHARRQRFLQGDVHAPGPKFSGGARHVVFAIDAKLAHMAAAFEPDVAEKGIESIQPGIGPHFEVQPVWPVPINQQVQDFR